MQVNHIKYLPYVLNDAVHLRIEEMESFASGESEAAKFFNKFRKENNPNYVLYRNGKVLHVIHQQYYFVWNLFVFSLLLLRPRKLKISNCLS